MRGDAACDGPRPGCGRRARRASRYGLAHTGIFALVDEVTGYQQMRAKDALTKILGRRESGCRARASNRRRESIMPVRIFYAQDNKQIGELESEINNWQRS